MIVALMIGRTGSSGFSGKNVKKVLGKALCEYPLIASKKSKYVDKLFVSTDCPIISKLSKKYGAILLKRPKHLATKKALGEEVFRDGYFKIKKLLQAQNYTIELLVLLMANAPTITGTLIDKGIKFRSMVLPDYFIDQDTPENMYKKAGLDANSIEEKVIETLKSNIILSKVKSKN